MSGKYNTFEDLVRGHVHFTGLPANGWHPCYCEHCGDGTRTKGPRGGWLFQGEMAFYNCFNQGCQGSYDIERDHPLSRGMSDILESFSVPLREYKLLELKLKQAAPGGTKKVDIKRSPILTMPVPSHFYLLSEAESDDLIAKKARRFLKDRMIDPASFPFYLSTGKATKAEGVREIELARTLKDRLIIPAFRGESLIYYQGRALDENAKKKYICPDTPRSNIILGMDRLYEDIRSPLFVTEGFFDAHLINGVATMENKLTSQQIELLNRSPRRKVIVPDRNGDSKRLAEDAVREGYGVSIPNWGGVKDVNEAVIKYGRLYVAKTLIDSIKFGPAAKLVVGMLR